MALGGGLAGVGVVVGQVDAVVASVCEVREVLHVRLVGPLHDPDPAVNRRAQCRKHLGRGPQALPQLTRNS